MGRDGRKMLLPHPTNRLVDWQRNMPVVCPVCEGIPESEGGKEDGGSVAEWAPPYKTCWRFKTDIGTFAPFSAAGALMLQGLVYLEMIDMNQSRLFYGAA